jgi:hypothetical protein
LPGLCAYGDRARHADRLPSGGDPADRGITHLPVRARMGGHGEETQCEVGLEPSHSLALSF